MADTLTNQTDMDTQSGLFEDPGFDGFSRAQVSMVLTNPNLDDNPIASGKPGPITKLFQRKYRRFARKAAAAIISG